MEWLAQILDILMFAALCVGLMMGYPVAFTLGGVSLIFGLLGLLLGAFDASFFLSMPQRIFGSMVNEVLIAVPLFVFMGVMLEKSRVAESLLETMGRAFGELRGGLGIAVLLVGALLAASTGIVGATVVTMGLMSLPTMLRHGYSPSLASGTVAAAGTLGQIIPPSIVLVVLGDQLSSAYQQAQLKQGNFSPETVTVGDLFAGALLPGLVLVALYLLLILLIAWLRPAAAPALPPGSGGKVRWIEILRALVPPIVLIVAVLGSIVAGVATPTEGASLGATGAILLAGYRCVGERKALVHMAAMGILGLLVLTSFLDLRLGRVAPPLRDQIGVALAAVLCVGMVVGIGRALYATWKSNILGPVVRTTGTISAMVFAIMTGASLFAVVFRGLGGEELVHAVLSDVPGGAAGAVVVVMLVMFVMGFFLDFLEIVFIVVPIVTPVLLTMDTGGGVMMSPVWLGVLMAMNLQTSFLTPPFGFSLFYLRSVAPSSVSTLQIYKGVIPFILLQLLMLLALWYWPSLATWLPKALF